MTALRHTIRTVIVDDERLARARIRRLLEARHPDVEIVCECSSGIEAIDAVAAERPDLLFLDIQMPEVDGFDVLAALSAEHRVPHVVFVTAYDRYAVRAFEVHAFDYLLKPLREDRLDAAVSRVRDAIRGHAGNSAQLERLLAGLGSRASRKFTIRSPERIYFVPHVDVDWIEAAGNYVRLHTAGDTHLLRSTMQAVEGALDATRFVRIHRSAIVNIDRIRELKPSFLGDFVVILRNGQRLRMSRTYRPALARITGNEPA